MCRTYRATVACWLVLMWLATTGCTTGGDDGEIEPEDVPEDAHMLAHDDTHRREATGHLVAGAEIHVRAYQVVDDQVDDQPFFNAHGGMSLLGELDPANSGTRWFLEQRVEPGVPTRLWTFDDFAFDDAAGVGAPPLEVATAELLAPIPVEIDLSTLPSGAQVIVVAEARVSARNSYSPEGGSIAFSSAAFQVDEAAGEALVTLERLGGTLGVIDATVTNTDGTAVESADYVPVSEGVAFQDGDAATASVRVPIIDNILEDGDRTIRLSLSAADDRLLATPAEALLTIVDNDAPSMSAGTLQLAAPSFAAAESDGVLTVEVTRLGGSTGGAALGTPGSAFAVIADDDGAPTAPPAAATLSALVRTKALVFEWTP